MATTALDKKTLLERHIGKFIDPEAGSVSAQQWKLKQTAYAFEGVAIGYKSLRISLQKILVDDEVANGLPSQYLVDKCAQLIIDGYLFRRNRGANEKVPSQVAVGTISAGNKDQIELYDATVFEDKKPISENEMIRWVFENMQTDGLLPKDAPSLGAWSLLQEVRDKPDFRKDFYKSMWPKLLAKEDAEKGGKLQDDGKTTIELLDKLLEALE